MEKQNKIFLIALLTLIFVLMISVSCGKIFQYQISALKDIESSKKHVDLTLDVDWEKLFPYTNEIDIETFTPSITETDSAEETSNNSDNTADQNVIEKLANKVSKCEDIGTNWAKTMYKYDELSKVALIISSRLKDASEGDYYIKLDNGYWIPRHTTITPQADADAQIIDYAILQNYLEEKNIDFLYCYAPNKECAVDPKLPEDVETTTNEDIDIYIDSLKKYDVNYIDMRECIHDDDLDHYSLFYKTDHHWTVEAGLWATSKIEDKISNEFGIQMSSPEDFGTYKETVYESALFGSVGRALTHFVESSEDFSIYFPEFDTDFGLEIPDYDLNVRGSFEDIFVNYDSLDEVISEGGGYAYETLLYGNRPYVKITNYNNPNGPKIFMIRDSFSIAVAPYLALSCSELVMVDTRAEEGNFSGSIISCIDDFQPDIVLTILSSPQDLTFNK